MQVTKLIADGVEKTIQGLHILPVGMKVVVDGDDYEVVDVEFMYANRLATVVVYLSALSNNFTYSLVDSLVASNQPLNELSAVDSTKD